MPRHEHVNMDLPTTLPEPYFSRVLQWVEALESGDYQQGEGRLKTILYDDLPDHYCCLGVATDCFKDKVNIIDRGHYNAFFDDVLDRTYVYLTPMPIIDYLGLRKSFTSFDGMVTQDIPVMYEDITYTLSWLNDQKLSFDNIAILIRNTYLGENNDLISDDSRAWGVLTHISAVEKFGISTDS